MSLNLVSGFPEFILRVNRPAEQKIYEFDDFRFEAEHLMLYRRGEELPLAPKAAETLLALIERGGEIVSKDELVQRIWPDAFVEESNLFLYLSILRKALGDRKNGGPYLETFRRRGYRFNGAVRLRRMNDNGAPRNGPNTRFSDRVADDVEPGSVRNDPLNQPENAEAWEFYLKGLHLVGRITPPDIQKSIEYFQKAIDCYPNYDLAYAALSRAFTSLPPSSDFPPTECFPKAEAAARKALEINSQLAEGHAALGWIMFWYKWDWKNSEDRCRRAIELNPESADGHYAYAHLLSNTGRHEEALFEMTRARELDPIWFLADSLEGQFLLHAGQAEEALDKLQRVVELFPEFWLAHHFLSSSYIEKGMYKEAEAEADLATQFSGASNHPAAFKGYALAKSGKTAEARAVLDELSRQSSERFVPPSYFALIYNGLGETEKAISWLERGFEQRDSKMVFLKVEPKWNNLRANPRFIRLLRRMNLN